MASAFWRTVLRFDATKIDLAIALRNTVGIVAPLIAGSALGNTSAGVVASLGALNACYSDSQDPYAIRVRRMLLASVVVALAVTVGALSAINHPVAVTVGVLWALGAGMMVVLGPQAGDLGAITLVTIFIFAARSLTPIEALESGLLAFAGGGIQVLLAIAFWPVNPWQPERRAIAATYRDLAQIAISPTPPDSPPPASGRMTAAQASLAQHRLTQDRSEEPERLSFLLNQAERIRLSLLSIRRLRHRIGREPGGEEIFAAIDRLLLLSSEILNSVGQSAEDGHGVPRLAGLSAIVDQIRAARWDSPLLNDARKQTEALAGQLRAASGLTGRETTLSPIASLKQNPLGPLMRLRANLSFNSTAFRHAVRLAASVGLGDALVRIFGLQRGYWLPMTVAIVLKPDFTTTFARGILRIAGTLLGLSIATVLFRLLHLGPATDIALIAIFALVLRWPGQGNYGIFVIGISGIAVLLIAITGVDPKDAIVARAVNTALGGALALAAYWVWPTWERMQTGPVISNMLKTYQTYYGHVMAAHRGDSPNALDGIRLNARLARSNAEASVTRFASEPGSQPGEVELMNAILVSSHTFVRALMAMEAGIYGGKIPETPNGTNEFCQDVEETLAALAESLKTHRPPAETLPDLREAWAALYKNPQPTFLEMGADRLTTSLNTLKEQVTQWSHAV